MKLGMVTYLWGKDWDLPTLLKNCEATGFEGVELRSTHKHGVEPSLTQAQRDDVRRQFEKSPVKCVGLGSACEFHSPDAAVVRQNIELTKQFLVLSREVGGSGVKVRPNNLVDGEARDVTINRIGTALKECGDFADDHGQQIRLEVHGKATSDPLIVRQIMDVANHPSVRVCWNSNPGEVVNGSIAKSFEPLKSHLSDVTHIHDLYDKSYPYRELFTLLRGVGYKGYCLSESPETSDPLRVMHYYKAMWEELTKA